MTAINDTAWTVRRFKETMQRHNPVALHPLIESIEELNALPTGTIVGKSNDSKMDAMQKNGGWFWCGSETEEHNPTQLLPFIVLWHPDWSAVL